MKRMLAAARCLIYLFASVLPADAASSDSTWREIDTWVNVFGVPAMDALRAATFWPAVFMKVEKEAGTVSPGKKADVIAVRGDVLRHVDLLQDVDVVIKGGVRYK
ncbi:MAG TPA: amidohydrolase family protein [Thermoanaerobaculia bacterium]|jgi:imidazolonepropionase-like amidohydrolase